MRRSVETKDDIGHRRGSEVLSLALEHKQVYLAYRIDQHEFQLVPVRQLLAQVQIT